MEIIRHEDRLRELRETGRGCIFNDFSRGPSGRQNNVLHESSCTWLRSANLNVAKVFFESVEEAVAWLDVNRPNNWKRCGTCLRRSSDAPVPDRAAHSDGDTDPFRESAVQEILVGYLQHRGYCVRQSQRLPSGIIDVIAESGTEKLAIEVKGEDRGGYTSAQMNFQMGIGQLMSRMADRGVQYAIAFPLTDDFRRVLRTYEGTFGFPQAGISAFVVRLDTSVLRLSPAEFQRFIDRHCEPNSGRAAGGLTEGHLQKAGQPEACSRGAEVNFLAPARIERALRGYCERAKNRAWLVSSKARLYALAETAFDPAKPDLDAFREIYEELRSYWQVFRRGHRWPSQQVFDVLLSETCQPCSREQLDLIKIAAAEDLQSVWRCLAAMSGVKTLRSGDVSAVAVSKFLHFFNPRLFPIFDRAVVKHEVIPQFRSSLAQSQARWLTHVASVASDALFACGLGDYLHYLLWASDCLANVDVESTMATFTLSFAQMLESEGRGARPPASIHLHYATAFEFAMIGASSSDSGGS